MELDLADKVDCFLGFYKKLGLGTYYSAVMDGLEELEPAVLRIKNEDLFYHLLDETGLRRHDIERHGQVEIRTY